MCYSVLLESVLPVSVTQCVTCKCVTQCVTCKCVTQCVTCMCVTQCVTCYTVCYLCVTSKCVTQCVTCVLHNVLPVSVLHSVLPVSVLQSVLHIVLPVSGLHSVLPVCVCRNGDTSCCVPPATPRSPSPPSRGVSLVTHSDAPASCVPVVTRSCTAHATFAPPLKPSQLINL